MPSFAYALAVTAFTLQRQSRVLVTYHRTQNLKYVPSGHLQKKFVDTFTDSYLYWNQLHICIQLLHLHFIPFSQ